MFSVVRTFLAVTVIALVTGCASVPTPDEMKSQVAGFALPKLPESGKAIVYVVRPSGVGPLIRFNVFVDDQEDASEMGYTRGSQYIYFNLKPGKHKILSKAENWAEAEVDAKAGDIIFIQQDASMGFLMARNSVMSIPDYQGKYHVKSLVLGTIAKSDK
ncbi:MAG TPA: DUF2846 domain-containing protein [Rhodocyclaceae bacterium]|nr:DUF2846 domain-containing protein [Rhodocyclaceae bacterium]